MGGNGANLGAVSSRFATRSHEAIRCRDARFGLPFLPRSNLNFHLDVRVHISAGMPSPEVRAGFLFLAEPLRRKPVIRARSARNLQEFEDNRWRDETL
jgi:hypothetical protein